MTPSGIEPATFRFVAQYLNHCATISGPPFSFLKWELIILNAVGLVGKFKKNGFSGFELITKGCPT
jgi:hypothetical protein